MSKFSAFVPTENLSLHRKVQTAFGKRSLLTVMNGSENHDFLDKRTTPNCESVSRIINEADIILLRFLISQVWMPLLRSLRNLERVWSPALRAAGQAQRGFANPFGIPAFYSQLVIGKYNFNQ